MTPPSEAPHDKTAAGVRREPARPMNPAAIPAVLHTDGWAGRQQQPCVVVGETAKRFRIRALPDGELRLPKGRHGLVKIFGQGTHLVPKTAITFESRPQ